MKDPYTVVKTVRVTEKGTAQTEALNQYQVVVDKHANKVDVKHAVEQLFKKGAIKGRHGSPKFSSFDTINYQ